MSVELREIHYQMYEKIKNQNKLTDYLALNNQINVAAPNYTESQVLDELIIDGEIHQSIEALVIEAENRYKHVVEALLNQYDLNEVKNQVYAYGQKLQSEGIKDLNMYTLDGMPCDQGISQEANKYILEASVHALPIEIITELRSSFINGLLNLNTKANNNEVLL